MLACRTDDVTEERSRFAFSHFSGNLASFRVSLKSRAGAVEFPTWRAHCVAVVFSVEFETTCSNKLLGPYVLTNGTIIHGL